MKDIKTSIQKGCIENKKEWNEVRKITAFV